MIKFKNLDSKFPSVALGFLVIPTNAVWTKSDPQTMGTVGVIHENPEFPPRTVIITHADGGPFLFSSADLEAGTLDELRGELAFNYTITGLLNGAVVYTNTNSLPTLPTNQAQKWNTISGDPSKPINLLSVTFATLKSGGVDHIAYGLRNINVTAVTH